MSLQSAIDGIDALACSFSGRIGVAAAWLGSYGEGPVWRSVPALEGLRPASVTPGRDVAALSPIRYHDAEAFRAASVIKLPILCEVFRQARAGAFSLEELVPVPASEQVTGSGVLKDLTPGLRLPVRDLAVLMITVSDNTATNLLIDRVGGPEAVNAFARGMGLADTVLSGKLQVSPDRYSELQRRGVRTTTSPQDMVSLLSALFRGDVPGLVDADCYAALDILTRQQHLPSIGRYVPFDPDSVEDREGVEAVVGSKSGSIRGVRNDVGIVWTGRGAYAVALMSRDCRDMRYHPENEAEVLLGRVGRIVFDYFVGGS